MEGTQEYSNIHKRPDKVIFRKLVKIVIQGLAIVAMIIILLMRAYS